MPVSHVYLPRQLPEALRRQGNALRSAVVKGLRRAAQRGLVEIDARITAGKPFPPVNTGQYRRSWKATPTKEGAILGSDAPYAAVLEVGRRPGAAGPPLAPILEWVYRKFRTSKGWRRGRGGEAGLNQAQEMLEIASKIRWAIHQRGTRPRHIMTGALGKLAAIAEREVNRACEEAAAEA